jgi:hypothetical protein
MVGAAGHCSDHKPRTRTIGPPFFALGIGRLSCAHWLSTRETENEGYAWIVGFWSAYNNVVPTNRTVGQNAGAEAIFAQIKKLCSEQPSLPMSEATARVYNQFEQDGN